MKNTDDSQPGANVATYKALRTASKFWFEKIMRHPACGSFDMHRVSGRTPWDPAVFDSLATNLAPPTEIP